MNEQEMFDKIRDSFGESFHKFLMKQKNKLTEEFGDPVIVLKVISGLLMFFGVNGFMKIAKYNPEGTINEMMQALSEGAILGKSFTEGCKKCGKCDEAENTSPFLN
jgi:hypothetical protein